MVELNKEMSQFMIDFVKQNPTVPKDFDMFMVTEESYIRFHNGSCDMGKNYVDTVILNTKKLKLERGEILAIFSKIEFLLNELINLYVIDYDAEKRILFDDILDNVNFHKRIELIHKWDLIENKEYNLFQQLKSVRNGFAHAWNKNEVYYKGILLEKNFDEFKKDLEKIWYVLLDIYKLEQTKIDIKEIRRKLGMK